MSFTLSCCSNWFKTNPKNSQHYVGEHCSVGQSRFCHSTMKSNSCLDLWKILKLRTLSTFEASHGWKPNIIYCWICLIFLASPLLLTKPLSYRSNHDLWQFKLWAPGLHHPIVLSTLLVMVNLSPEYVFYLLKNLFYRTKFIGYIEDKFQI